MPQSLITPAELERLKSELAKIPQIEADLSAAEKMGINVEAKKKELAEAKAALVKLIAGAES